MATRTLNIGLVAYGVSPELVMVRVPNERARWMLTNRCVVEVDCPRCGSIAGEPCKRWSNMYGRKREAPAGAESYHVGVHCDRKSAAVEKIGRHYAYRQPHPKLRVTSEDLAAALAIEPDPLEQPEPEGIDIDVPVTRREEPR